MFKGFVLSESLKNPTILNNYRKIYVKIEKHAESREYPFWHLFKIQINDKDVGKAAKQISRELKRGWYAHFWDKKTVIVCFVDKNFRIPRKGLATSKEFQEAKKYGMRHGIGERYLDFWIED